MKKKNSNILCLSWCDADDVMNYGQILQGCALMYCIRKITNSEITYVSYLPRGIKGQIMFLLKHYNPFSGHLKAYLRSKTSIRQFVKRYNINFYQVRTFSELDKKANNVDVMICGSDQIWHPQNYDKGYFLDFGSEKIKRISYAASLPKTKIESQFSCEFEKISKSINRIDIISVREKKSKNFISQLSNKEVKAVVDPTYLVPKEVWKDIVEKIVTPNKYIFVYIPNGMDENMFNYVNEIKFKLGINKVLIMMTRGTNYFSSSDSLKFVSLGQFLYLIKNAECVITTSYHAIIFSTIYQKKFWCYDVPNNTRGEDVRLDDLLENLGLESRKLENFKKWNASESINYELVENKLLSMIRESWSFLKSTIS